MQKKEHKKKELIGNITRTNTINPNFNPRTQDLVPAVYAPDEPAGAFEAAGAAEGVREAGGGEEVFFEGRALGRRWGLR